MYPYGAPAPTPQTCKFQSSQQNREQIFHRIVYNIFYFIDYWPTGQPTNTPLGLSRAGANAVTGGAQHVAGPLAGAQGAPVVPQGTLQQPTQQTQPLPSMGISLSQTGKSYVIYNY